MRLALAAVLIGVVAFIATSWVLGLLLRQARGLSTRLPRR